MDPRWIRVRRPVITVGGELTLEQLDLKFNHLAKFYEAPVQLKANCGVLLVDDFGRQRIPASDLLNRSIVPLEARVDYLALHTGRKFEVPFEETGDFATKSGAAKAHRRGVSPADPLQGPRHEPVAQSVLGQIFDMVCGQHGIPFNPAVLDHLCREDDDGRGLEMRACHPRDLIEQMVMLCRYRKQPVTMSTQLLDEACRNLLPRQAVIRDRG